MKKVTIYNQKGEKAYFTNGQKTDFTTGESINGEKVENIFLLNPNAVAIHFASGSETVFGNMPFIYHDITSS